MLSKDFIDERTSSLVNIPNQWKVENPNGYFYQIDLKMCQLKSLNYTFIWGFHENVTRHKVKSVTEAPGKILKLNLSLNQLSILDSQSLSVFSNLRDLDASLNRLHNVPALESLHHLNTLNLSHNSLMNLSGLELCRELTELRLGMNQLNDISAVSSLCKLTVLFVDNNQLDTLYGVQHLPKLRELHAHRNSIASLTEVGACLSLYALNVADNVISDLQSTVDALSHLSQLTSLSLYGNPIERDPAYRGEITTLTSVSCLDNSLIRQPAHLASSLILSTKHTDNLTSLLDATRNMFQDKIAAEERKMEENVAHLHTKILQQRREFGEYEAQTTSDMERCLVNLESLSAQELERFDHTKLTAPTDSLRRHSPQLHSTKAKGEDYKHIKDTDEVLRCAYIQLARDNEKQ